MSITITSKIVSGGWKSIEKNAFKIAYMCAPFNLLMNYIDSYNYSHFKSRLTLLRLQFYAILKYDLHRPWLLLPIDTANLGLSRADQEAIIIH